MHGLATSAVPGFQKFHIGSVFVCVVSGLTIWKENSRGERVMVVVFVVAWIPTLV